MVAATARAPGDQIVALLFTDIEGSTRLARRLGPAWEETLERHRAIARAAFAHHGAGEVATEGDSFFVVFQDPLDAVQAAVELQAYSAKFVSPSPSGSTLGPSRQATASITGLKCTARPESPPADMAARCCYQRRRSPS